MDPRLALTLTLVASASVVLFAWLVVGRAPGRAKRIVWRAALLCLAGALVWSGQGLFVRSSLPFAVLIGAILLLVVLGQLYSVRFCASCGRMVRNFRRDQCPRCGLALPRHGFTEALRVPPEPRLAPRPRGRPARAIDRLPS